MPSCQLLALLLDFCQQADRSHLHPHGGSATSPRPSDQPQAACACVDDCTWWCCQDLAVAQWTPLPISTDLCRHGLECTAVLASPESCCRLPRACAGEAGRSVCTNFHWDAAGCFWLGSGTVLLSTNVIPATSQTWLCRRTLVQTYSQAQLGLDAK